VREGEPKQVRLAMFGITAVPALSDLDEAQRFGLAYCRRDGVVIDAIVDEVLLRDDQRSVVITPVIAEFDFDTGDHTVRRQAERTVGRATQHLD
jgi:hypothetical protein